MQSTNIQYMPSDKHQSISNHMRIKDLKPVQAQRYNT